MSKETGISKVWASAVPWSDRALHMLAVYAYKAKGEFTLDGFREYAEARGLGHPHHENAWGALMHTAARQNLIKPSGNLYPSNRPEAHKRLIRSWVLM